MAPKRKRIQAHESASNLETLAQGQHEEHPPRASGAHRPLVPDVLPLEALPETLSHKHRRKRKKLQEKACQVPLEDLQTSGCHDALDRGPSTASTPVAQKPLLKSTPPRSIFTTKQRSKYSVWVGNLLFSTSAQDLHQFLAKCGCITRVNMPPGNLRRNEQNKGFAHVDFEDELGLNRALEKSENLLGGRKLLIKNATDFSRRPLATSSSTPLAEVACAQGAFQLDSSLTKSARRILKLQKEDPGPCLYLGNLGFETTEDKILNILESNHQTRKSKKSQPNSPPDAAGDTDEVRKASSEAGIRKVRMGTFEDTGRCKGFAFVDFQTVQQATDALLDIRNHSLDGRTLVVEYASPDAIRRGGGAMTEKSKLTCQKKGPNPQGRPSVRADAAVAKHNGNEGAAHDPPDYKSKRPSLQAHHTMGAAAAELRETKDSSQTPLESKPKKKPFQGRQTPGAALANAKRGSMGMVRDPEKMGTKIRFD